jgi:hypothetical protein
LVSPFNSSEGLDPNELEPPLGLLGTVIPEICGSLLAFVCVEEKIGERCSSKDNGEFQK